MSHELDRFLTLFDALVTSDNSSIAKIYLREANAPAPDFFRRFQDVLA